MIRILFLTCFLFSALSASKHEQMIADLESIGNVFKVHYAPVLWKKQHKHWDLHQQVELSKDSINLNNKLTVKDYQQIVRRFFRSIHDYHCSVRFHSTEFAALPFEVVGAEDRYFVTDVKEGGIPQKSILSEGDEIVTFNGRPIHDVILELQREEFGTDHPGTDRSLATIFLTRRFASSGSSVPNGIAEIGVRSPSRKHTKTMRLNWYYRPEKITHYEKVNAELDRGGWERMMLTPLYAELTTPYSLEVSRHDLGHKEGFLPPMGKVLWSHDSKATFRAYLFEHNGKKIGYVRIPHYRGAEEEVMEFSEIIRFLEKTSDALVIDQLNNPGGSVFYLYALASMLTQTRLETPKHALTITPREVEFAVNTIPALQGIEDDAQARKTMGHTISGYPVTLEAARHLLQFCRFIVDEWNANHTLTGPTFLYGVNQINPYPNIHYTKPILMLINEMDFSGGDFMPAILQDNKRAVLMGVKTAGAGGFVAKTSFPNRFGIDYFYYTASIALRIDQNPIENLGVTPDIPYALTPDDLQGGYQSFVREILKNLDELVH